MRASENTGFSQRHALGRFSPWRGIFVRLDVIVVAATNCDLEMLVREKKFRADLFFRLNVLRLDLVPLHQRRGDIALLARHFLENVSAENGIPPKHLTAAAVCSLSELDWPGKSCSAIESFCDFATNDRNPRMRGRFRIAIAENLSYCGLYELSKSCRDLDH
jgi:hypothetical protein